MEMRTLGVNSFARGVHEAQRLIGASNPYHLGIAGNVLQVLGRNPLNWILPLQTCTCGTPVMGDPRQADEKAIAKAQSKEMSSRGLGFRRRRRVKKTHGDSATKQETAASRVNADISLNETAAADSDEGLHPAARIGLQAVHPSPGCPVEATPTASATEEAVTDVEEPVVMPDVVAGAIATPKSESRHAEQYSPRARVSSTRSSRTTRISDLMDAPRLQHGGMESGSTVMHFACDSDDEYTDDEEEEEMKKKAKEEVSPPSPKPICVCGLVPPVSKFLRHPFLCTDTEATTEQASLATVAEMRLEEQAQRTVIDRADNKLAQTDRTKPDGADGTVSAHERLLATTKSVLMAQAGHSAPVAHVLVMHLPSEDRRDDTVVGIDKEDERQAPQPSSTSHRSLCVVCTIDMDGRSLIWHPDTGRLLHMHKLHCNFVSTAVTLSPRSLQLENEKEAAGAVTDALQSILVTGSWDGFVKATQLAWIADDGVDDGSIALRSFEVGCRPLCTLDVGSPVSHVSSWQHVVVVTTLFNHVTLWSSKVRTRGVLIVCTVHGHDGHNGSP